jgi:type IV fimbrial biogenesis protein FimT
LATPSFRDFTRSNQVTSTNNDLVTALNLARSEALRRSTGVTVCSSANGTSCGLAKDWGSGWIVFEDAAGTGVIASADKVVQKWSGTSNGVKLDTVSKNIQYQPIGIAASSVTIDVFPDSCKGPRKRHIQVSAAGSISTQLQTCP